jgi:hypothetical protein
VKIDADAHELYSRAKSSEDAKAKERVTSVTHDATYAMLLQLNLLAKPPFEANAVAVANDQHPNHELGINRRPANIAVEGRQFLA